MYPHNFTSINNDKKHSAGVLTSRGVQSTLLQHGRNLHLGKKHGGGRGENYAFGSLRKLTTLNDRVFVKRDPMFSVFSDRAA